MNKRNSGQTEEELVRACQQNVRLAQAELFDRYAGRLLGIALRFTGDRDIANDLLQETFIRIFRHIGNFRFTGSFEGWIKRIMVNTSVDYMKRNGRLQMEDADEVYDERLSVAPVPLENMNCEAIMHEIGLLPPGYRTVLNLYAIEGYSYPEIAAMLGVREVTVRSQYLRAKQKLATSLMKKKIIHYEQKIV